MCDVEVSAEGVRINPRGWEHAGGMTGDFVVELSAIAAVSTSDDPLSLVHGMKVGVGLPKTKIGTWRHDGVADYICVRDGGAAVVIKLVAGQRFATVVVTVPDPDRTAADIRGAMPAQAGPA